MNELLKITVEICKDFFSWWMTTFKKNNNKGKWLLVCLSLVMVCMIIDLPYYCFNMDSFKSVPTKTVSVKTEVPIATKIIAITPTITNAKTIVETKLPVPETAKSNIPGITAGDLTTLLNTKGIECSRPNKTKTLYIRNCSLEDSGYELNVDIYGSGILNIDYVFIKIASTGKIDTIVANSFLGYVSTLSYENAQPEQARKWIETNLPTLKGVDDIRKKKFSNVDYVLYGDPTGYFLEIGDLPKLN